MTKTGYIYKITSPIGRIYIGQTINLKRRICSYRNLFCNNQPRLSRSIKKYGWENHILEIIDECNVNELDSKEIFYIKFYSSFETNHGLNLTSGGKSGVLAKHIIKRISNKNRGRSLSVETRNKLRLANLGKKQSEETKAKKLIKIKGRKRSQQTKDNISKGRTGIKFSETHIKNLKNCYRPPINDSTKIKISNSLKGLAMPHRFGNKFNGKKVINKATGEVFDTLVEACKKYGYDYNKCKTYLRGECRNKTPLERYDGSIPTIDYFESLKIKMPFHDRSKRIVLNTETGIYYDSIRQAAESSIFSIGYINNMLKGRVLNKTTFICV